MTKLGHDDDETVAAASRTLALLRAQSDAVRTDLAALRREMAKVRQDLASLRGAEAHDANAQLVQAAIQADTAAKTAVSSLDELSLSTQHDELTGASNRVLMLDRLEGAIAMAQRRGGRVGVLFIDLDGFKPINDRLGHAAGDQVLRLAAQRMAAAVRESDSVSRYGGDEFVVLLAEMNRASDAALIARKMLESLAQPADIGAGHTVSLSASIGVSMYPDDGADATALVHCADAAMYQAKRRGGRGYAFCEGSDDGPDASEPEPIAPAAARRAGAALVEHEARLREMVEANHELVGAAQAAQRLQAHAEEAHRRQIRFVAMAAHALRNPLSAIRMANTTLANARTDTALREKHGQLVQRQTSLIARLIDDLIDGSRVGSGSGASEFSLQLRDLALDAIVAAAADACRHALDAKQQTLAVHGPLAEAQVHGDPQRLVQVFGNLVNHASRRSPTGAGLRLTVELATGEVVARIADQGEPMAAEQLDRAFDLFAVDDPARPPEDGGLGIGLAVVRALVEAHGGGVAARNRADGSGGEIEIRLPRSAAG